MPRLGQREKPACADPQTCATAKSKQPDNHRWPARRLACLLPGPKGLKKRLGSGASSGRPLDATQHISHASCRHDLTLGKVMKCLHDQKVFGFGHLCVLTSARSVFFQLIVGTEEPRIVIYKDKGPVDPREDCVQDPKEGSRLSS